MTPHYQTAFDDEELRKRLKPNPLSHEQILSILRSNYTLISPSTLTIHIESLPSYDDVNYLIRIVDSDNSTPNRQYVFKLHNGVESSDYLTHQQAGTETSAIHLQQYIAHHFDTPQSKLHSHRIVPTLDKHLACVQDLPVTDSSQSPRSLVMHLFHWIPGRTMSCSSLCDMVPDPSNPELPLHIHYQSLQCLHQAGVTLANVRHSLDELATDNPNALLAAQQRVHAWDVRYAHHYKHYLSYLPPHRQPLIDSILTVWERQPPHPEYPMGILHGDYNDANILLSPTGHVSAIIDFGDSIYSWRVWDIAIAMAYAMSSSYYGACTDRSCSAAAALLRGFHSVTPLTSDEQQSLVLLVSVRLVCSVVMGAFSIVQDPSNEYLKYHAEPAWNVLTMLWGNGGSGRRRVLEELCVVACEEHVVTEHEYDCLDLCRSDGGAV